MTSPSASTGPAIEWRGSDAFVNDLAIGTIGDWEDDRWFWDGAAASGEASSELAARTACEAAICDWFAKAGWPQSLSPQAEGTSPWPMVAALLRIVYQSFDAGGESSRSQRAQALEAVLFSISRNDDPAFEAARRECDSDPWEYIMRSRDALTASCSQGDGGYAAGLEAAAKVADAHKGSAEKRRKAKPWKPDPEALDEIRTEERGENIAAEMIAAAIRAMKGPAR